MLLVATVVLVLASCALAAKAAEQGPLRQQRHGRGAFRAVQRKHDRLARPLPGDDRAVLGGLGHGLGHSAVVNVHPHAAGLMGLERRDLPAVRFHELNAIALHR